MDVQKAVSIGAYVVASGFYSVGTDHAAGQQQHAALLTEGAGDVVVLPSRLKGTVEQRND